MADSLERIQLFHNTCAEFMSNISAEGLIPGKEYDKEFYGISTPLMDRYAPPKLRQHGVLRSNVVFSWLREKDAVNERTEDTTSLKLLVNPNRVYVADVYNSGATTVRIWNKFLSPVEKQIFDIWAIQGEKDHASFRRELSRSLWRYFLDDNFLEQLCTVAEIEDPEMKSRLNDIIKNTKKIVSQKGRDVARSYWRRVVPYDTFNSNFEFDQNKKIWLSKEKHHVGIHYPEALIVGPVEPNDISVIR